MPPRAMRVGVWAVALLAAGAAASGCEDAACVKTFAKCGGARLAGQPRACCSPEDSCVEKNPFYAQCMPAARAAVKVSNEGWTGTVLACDGTAAAPSAGSTVDPVDPGLPGPDPATACCCSADDPCEDLSVCAAVSCAAPGTGDDEGPNDGDYIGDYEPGQECSGDTGDESSECGDLECSASAVPVCGGGYCYCQCENPNEFLYCNSPTDCACLAFDIECSGSDASTCGFECPGFEVATCSDGYCGCGCATREEEVICDVDGCACGIREPECIGDDASTCSTSNCTDPEVAICGDGYCYCGCPNPEEFLYCNGVTSCNCIPFAKECSGTDASACGFECPGFEVTTCSDSYCTCGCATPGEETICDGDSCACGVREPECTVDDTSTCTFDCPSPSAHGCFNGYCNCECPSPEEYLYCEGQGDCDCFPATDECGDGDASSCGIKCFEPEVTLCQDGNCTCGCPEPNQTIICRATGCACTDALGGRPGRDGN